MLLQEIADFDTAVYIHGDDEASLFLAKTSNYKIEQNKLTPESTLLKNVFTQETLN